MRIGSWAVESMCLRSRATQRGGCTRKARTAAAAAMATKRKRRRKVTLGSRLVRRTATATMGPNSPVAPTARITGPSEVSQDAVVAQDGQQGPERRRGETHADHDRVEHQMGGGKDRPDAQGEQERNHPGTPCPAEVAVAHGGQVELGPGQEHQIGQAEVGERSHQGVRVGQRQHVRGR